MFSSGKALKYTSPSPVYGQIKKAWVVCNFIQENAIEWSGNWISKLCLKFANFQTINYISQILPKERIDCCF